MVPLTGDQLGRRPKNANYQKICELLKATGEAENNRRNTSYSYAKHIPPDPLIRVVRIAILLRQSFLQVPLTNPV